MAGEQDEQVVDAALVRGSVAHQVVFQDQPEGREAFLFGILAAVVGTKPFHGMRRQALRQGVALGVVYFRAVIDHEADGAGQRAEHHEFDGDGIRINFKEDIARLPVGGVVGGRKRHLAVRDDVAGPGEIDDVSAVARHAPDAGGNIAGHGLVRHV